MNTLSVFDRRFKLLSLTVLVVFGISACIQIQKDCDCGTQSG